MFKWLINLFKKDPNRIIMFRSSNSVQWRRHNKLHRDDDKPAYIHFTKTGEITEEAWYVNGINHRVGGPSSISYSMFVEGATTYEYCQWGKLHRLDGPAIWDDRGYEDWWINDRYIEELRDKYKGQWPLSKEEQIELKLKYM